LRHGDASEGSRDTVAYARRLRRSPAVHEVNAPGFSALLARKGEERGRRNRDHNNLGRPVVVLLCSAPRVHPTPFPCSRG